jgi:hypothetical protein
MNGMNSMNGVNGMNGMNDINGMNNNDIDLFINTYEKELNNGIIPHPKIGLWIQYLKSLKFYNINNIDKDPFFDKRHSITKNDIKEINTFMNRIKKGKHLYKNDNYGVIGGGVGVGGGVGGGGVGGSNNSFIHYNYVDDNDDDEDNNKGSSNKNHFELLSQVEGALYEYNEKIKKNKNKNKNNQDRSMDRNQLKIRESPMNICPNNNKYGVQNFAEDPVNNANLSNAINQLENTEKLINYNYTNRFDNEFKRSIPNIANNKRHQEHNTRYNLVNDNLVNDNLVNHNYSNINGAIGVGATGMGATGTIADRYKQDALYTNNYRFNQDQDILKVNLITRETSQKNKQPFENQFQYLDCNYNKIPNKSLIGESSRMDNRTYIH